MSASTTSKITKSMARSIVEFCRTTGQGVIVRQAGQEVGFTYDDQDTVLAQCTIPKTTLDQIGYVPSTTSTKGFSVRYTSIDTLVRLAGELHEAYTALNEFSKSNDPNQHVDTLHDTETIATCRLANAIGKSTPERVEQACRACGEIGYVFDGF